jgi:hypothetical protein
MHAARQGTLLLLDEQSYRNRRPIVERRADKPGQGQRQVNQRRTQRGAPHTRLAAKLKYERQAQQRDEHRAIGAGEHRERGQSRRQLEAAIGHAGQRGQAKRDVQRRF